MWQAALGFVRFSAPCHSRLSRSRGLAAKPRVCRTMPSCDGDAEQEGDMRIEPSTQGGVEALAGLAAHVPIVGANAHVCAPPACAQLLAHGGVPVGVWQ